MDRLTSRSPPRMAILLEAGSRVGILAGSLLGSFWLVQLDYGAGNGPCHPPSGVPHVLQVEYFFVGLGRPDYLRDSGARSPSSAARTAAWVRSETPSLPIMRCT